MGNELVEFVYAASDSAVAAVEQISLCLEVEGDSVAWPPELRFDIKNPPSVSQGGLTITRDPFRCRLSKCLLTYLLTPASPSNVALLLQRVAMQFGGFDLEKASWRRNA